MLSLLLCLASLHLPPCCTGGASFGDKDVPIDLDLKIATDVLPPNKDHVAYKGSLTTPPCDERVLWHLFKQPKVGIEYCDVAC